MAVSGWTVFGFQFSVKEIDGQVLSSAPKWRLRLTLHETGLAAGFILLIPRLPLGDASTRQSLLGHRYRPLESALKATHGFAVITGSPARAPEPVEPLVLYIKRKQEVKYMRGRLGEGGNTELRSYK